ncbi:MAG: bifunctional heptose 7-phosphate kinase/heptose 1-phosphate adenyltransferase [Cyanophyceae cyanobacterium]
MTNLPTFSSQLQKAATSLMELLDRFHQGRVLVVGDLTLDEFLNGRVERVSREAPVLIIRHEGTRQVPGGGANAIYNLATLGGRVQAVGLGGDDSQGVALREIFEARSIDTTGILVESDRPTVTKTRISAHARQSVTQQIVRVDRKSDQLPQGAISDRLAVYIRDRIGDSTIIDPTEWRSEGRSAVDEEVCSDYGDGVFTPSVIQSALKGHTVVVDAQGGLPRFGGATWFTPNLPAAEQAEGYSIKTEAALRQAGQDLLETTQAKFILITRGDEGMSLFEQGFKANADEMEGQGGDRVHHIPAFNRAEVFDVTGAGDTVVAALTLALTQGASPWVAAVLGNLAASLVVRHVGTATTTVDEMKRALGRLLKVGTVDAGKSMKDVSK